MIGFVEVHLLLQHKIYVRFIGIREEQFEKPDLNKRALLVRYRLTNVVALRTANQNSCNFMFLIVESVAEGLQK